MEYLNASAIRAARNSLECRAKANRTRSPVKRAKYFAGQIGFESFVIHAAQRIIVQLTRKNNEHVIADFVQQSATRYNAAEGDSNP